MPEPVKCPICGHHLSRERGDHQFCTNTNCPLTVGCPVSVLSRLRLLQPGEVVVKRSIWEEMRLFWLAHFHMDPGQPAGEKEAE